MSRKQTKVKVGDKFGMLIVTSLAPRREGSAHLYWNCACDCGHRAVARSSALAAGQVQSCGCLRSSSPKMKAANHARRSPLSSWRQIWNNYKGGAKKRGLEFLLSVLEFKAICEQPCYMCGALPKEDRSVYNMHKLTSPDSEFRVILRNGIDRQDNMKGYVPGNCQPCCAVCNIAKHTLTAAEFRSWILQAAEYLKSKGVPPTPGQFSAETAE